ncbi:MAG: hypothetical protein AAFU54_06245 [Chloroflexota bacterium]
MSQEQSQDENPLVPGEQSFMPDKDNYVNNQLRKLNQHLRGNVPSEIAQKSQGSFDVHPDASGYSSQSVESPVQMMVYPQDPFVGEPEVRELPPAEVNSGLHNSRIRIKDSTYPPAQPDDDNNYLYWVGTPEFNQVNAFYYGTLTLRTFEKFAHRRIPWAFGAPRLNIDPHFSRGTNAMYDEQNHLVAFSSFEFEGESYNTAQSADVAVHETAHAVLDGMRDLYNESFGMGSLAFHESFGDMAAVLVALQDDSLIQRLLEWTDGDLRTKNFVAEVAEHLVETIHSRDRMTEINTRTVYLRNALNGFVYRPFDEMVYFPEDPAFELGRESHNYSRLFTGAFYDMLVLIYEHLRDDVKLNPRIALHRARDLMGHLLAYAVEVGPVGELKFADMARAFLTADVLLHGGKHRDIMQQVFADRLILSPDEAEAHLAAQRNLPKIMLPEYVDSSLEAGVFLLEQVIPALSLPDADFRPMSAHRNQRGFSFLTYFTSQRVVLTGDHYGPFQGASVDAFGGISLAFNPQRELVSALYRPVTDEDIRQIQAMTADLIDHGLVTDQTLNGRGKILSDVISAEELPSVQPRLLYLNDYPLHSTTDDGKKLVRVPMIFDAFPEQPEDFVAYLKQWKNR